VSGYANRVITKHFPDLVEPGDDIWVTIRNPRLMSPGEFTSSGADLEIGPDGQPVANPANERAVNRLGAKLIIGMRVYDPTAPVELDAHGEPVQTDEPPPLLPVKPEAEDIAKLPIEIINWLAGELAKVNPQSTPESPGATGTPS